MSVPASPLRITKTVNLNEVRWLAIESLLSTRSMRPDGKAELRAFQKKLSFLNFGSWFIHPKLSEAENAIASALCELEGSDRLVLCKERALNGNVLPLRCTFELTVEPMLRRGEDGAVSGSAVPRVTIHTRWGNWTIVSRFHFVVLSVILFSVAALSYALLSGALLYGAAVFLLLILNPAEVASTASRNFSMGIALLCFLTGVAGIFGKAVRNLFRLTKKGATKPRR